MTAWMAVRLGSGRCRVWRQGLIQAALNQIGGEVAEGSSFLAAALLEGAKHREGKRDGQAFGSAAPNNARPGAGADAGPVCICQRSPQWRTTSVSLQVPRFRPLAGSTSVMVCSEWSRFQGFGRSEEKACKGWGVAWLALGLIRGIGLGCSLPVLEALVDQLKD
jgi:hypothetical protein